MTGLEALPLVWLVLSFAFMNGASDCGTMAASVVGSRTLTPRAAAVTAGLCSFAGAMLLGSAVAKTFGTGLVRLDLLPAAANPFGACLAAVAAAFAWTMVAWLFGLPSPYTQALLGGWFGAFMGMGGAGVVDWRGAGGVLMAVLFVPLLGFFTAWGAMSWFYEAGQELSLRTKGLFRNLEVAGFAALCFAHGANAAQKSMAILVLAAIGAGSDWPWPAHLDIPLWVRTLCSAAFALGVTAGSSRTLKSVAFGMFRVSSLHSAASLAVSGVLLFSSTMAGVPLSPAQVNSSTLLGTGAARQQSAVRWNVAADFFASWLMTFPVCAGLAYFVVKFV